MQNTPIFEENGPENFKGIDIMRAVRSFDPCLPCGVHMYLGKGRVKKVVHTPTGSVLMAVDPRAARSSAFQELTARLESIDDVEARGDRRGAAWPRCSSCTARGSSGSSTPSTAAPEVPSDALARDGVVAQPAPDPRPLPGAARRSGWRRRSTACGRTWSRTAAASSSSGSRTASRTCACTAAATAVPRRRRRWSSRSGRRSRRPRRTSTGSRSRGRRAEARAVSRRLPLAGSAGPASGAGSSSTASPGSRSAR